jgi:hypothetical protein
MLWIGVVIPTKTELHTESAIFIVGFAGPM